MKRANRLLSLLHISLSLLFISTQAEAAKIPTKPLVYGHSQTIQSKILKQTREIFISLPEGYEHNTGHKYPVILVFDAEFLFEATQAMVKLNASRNNMPQSIVVGLSNVAVEDGDKRLDMALRLKHAADGPAPGFGGQDGDYLRFFREELFPQLGKQYRIADHRTAIGLSPTNGPLTHDLLSYEPKQRFFHAYILLAPSLQMFLENGEALSAKLVDALNKPAIRDTAVYIGRAEEDAIRNPPVAEVFDHLATQLAQTKAKNIRRKVEIIAGDNHYGMAIRGIQNGLELVFPRTLWNVDFGALAQAEKPLQTFKNHYQKLSQIYGFQARPIESSFWSGDSTIGLVRRLNGAGRAEESQAVLRYANTLFPNSSEIQSALAQSK